MTIKELTANDLRKCHNLLRNTRNADRWTAVEWLQLHAGYAACGWDLTPDTWAWWQVEACLNSGVVPQWGENECDPIAPGVVQDRSGNTLCPHCGTPWVFGDNCSNCGGPAKEST